MTDSVLKTLRERLDKASDEEGGDLLSHYGIDTALDEVEKAFSATPQAGVRKAFEDFIKFTDGMTMTDEQLDPFIAVTAYFQNAESALVAAGPSFDGWCKGAMEYLSGYISLCDYDDDGKCKYHGGEKLASL